MALENVSQSADTGPMQRFAALGRAHAGERSECHLLLYDTLSGRWIAGAGERFGEFPRRGWGGERRVDFCAAPDLWLDEVVSAPTFAPITPLWPQALQSDDPQFGELAQVLAAVRGKRVVLLRNRGNRGDGVIHMGARRLLSAVGLDYVDIHQPEAPNTIDAEVLLVVAGGAFCRTTHSIVSVIERYAPTVTQVIILPASFDVSCGEVRRFARSWDQRFTVFCRERRSFEALRALPVRAESLLLSHDLAFCADLQPWAERPATGSVAIVRRDREAVFDRRPLDMGGRDISRGSDAEAEILLDYVARFAVVHTDRTHAAITAAMMGRDVWLYRNAYFKNQAIFEHSLSRMPNVRFVGKQAFSLRQCGAALYTHYVQRNAYLLRKRWRDWKASKSAA